MQFDKQTALKKLGISEEMYDELTRMFIAQTEPVLKNLDDFIRLKDFRQIARLAHSINGSAANLRIEIIRGLAENIDLQAKENKDIKMIEENASKLKIAFEEFKKITESENEAQGRKNQAR